MVVHADLSSNDGQLKRKHEDVTSNPPIPPSLLLLPPLPEDWTIKISDQNGEQYYYHEPTQETRWDRPILTINNTDENNTSKSLVLEKVLNRKNFGQKFAGLPDHNMNDHCQVVNVKSILTTRQYDTPPPILIMGSSGSGKTVFASYTLPKLLTEIYLGDDNKFFTVHLRGDIVRSNLHHEITSAEAAISVANAVSEEIVNIVTRCREIEIKKTDICHSKMAPDIQEVLNIRMVVIIDEVGIQLDSKWADSKQKLIDLTNALKEVFKVKGVQLVLAGTGLDGICSLVNSEHDSVKIRMKSWEIKDMTWWVNHCLVGCEPTVKRRIICIITNTPILFSLGTNARAAGFLINCLRMYDQYFDKTALIDHTVTTVAFNYIHANGLKVLDVKQRQRVAKIVLGVLQDAKKMNATALLPVACTNEHHDVQRACFSLVDTYIERDNLKPGQCFSISVSPAITIVLTALMGSISTLSSSWSGFEKIVALAEIQRRFVASKEDQAPRIIRSRLTFPATNPTKKIKIPKIGPNLILINGLGAPYADVISHRRLIQCKHTADVTDQGISKLNLKNELSKMGVLKCEHYNNNTYPFQRFLTKQLVQQWWQEEIEEDSTKAEADEVIANGDMHIDTVKLSPKDGNSRYNLIPTDGTRSMYPMGQLDISDQVEEVGFETFTYENGNFFAENGKDPPIYCNSSGLFKSEITVVFSTNKGGFSLEGIPGTALDVRRQHLDNDGKLEMKDEKATNQYIVEFLNTLIDTTKVHVRFQVCSH